MDILALLQPIESSLPKTTLQQMSRVIMAMLAMTGRVTMLVVSRWAGAGGSYRTIQRFYHTVIPWADVFWQLFRDSLFQKGGVYLLESPFWAVFIAKNRLFPQPNWRRY